MLCEVQEYGLHTVNKIPDPASLSSSPRSYTLDPPAPACAIPVMSRASQLRCPRIFPSPNVFGVNVNKSLFTKLNPWVPSGLVVKKRGCALCSLLPGSASHSPTYLTPVFLLLLPLLPPFPNFSIHCSLSSTLAPQATPQLRDLDIVETESKLNLILFLSPLLLLSWPSWRCYHSPSGRSTDFTFPSTLTQTLS